MRIAKVEAIPIRVPLIKPIVMSHITVAHSDNVLVKITTDDGAIGWGEGVEATDLTGETQESIAAAVGFLGERIIGKDPLARTALWTEMAAAMYGNDTAAGAIDIALHDLAGKVLGVPVVQLLGGPSRDRVAALTMVGSGVPDDDIATARAKYDSGYRWLKVKLAIGDPADELRTMTGIRAELPADAVVCGDANQGWSEPEAIRFLRELDGQDVAFIEQPIRQGDIDAMVRVAQSSPIPICADQSVHSFADIASFWRTGVAGVSLKMVKLGGVTGVMRGAALCDAFDLSINLAGKIAESSVAAAANVHCAAAMNSVAFGCSPGNQGIAEDITTAPLVVEDGHYTVPTVPGLGIDVDDIDR